MAGAGKHLLARDVKLDRHADDFCRHGGEEFVRPDRAFAAESAADEWANDAHVFHLQAVVRASMLCTPLTNWVAFQTVSFLSPSQAAIVPDISIGLCVSVGVM